MGETSMAVCGSAGGQLGPVWCADGPAVWISCYRNSPLPEDNSPHVRMLCLLLPSDAMCSDHVIRRDLHSNPQSANHIALPWLSRPYVLWFSLEYHLKHF